MRSKKVMGNKKFDPENRLVKFVYMPSGVCDDYYCNFLNPYFLFFIFYFLWT